MPLVGLWAIRLFLALLLVFSLLIEAYFVPVLGLEVIQANPEARDMFVPALLWSVLFIGCAQVALVVVWRLVSLIEQERIFSTSALSWVRALIATALVALGLVVLAFIVLTVKEYTPPLIMYGLIGTGLLLAAFALAVGAMRGLLRKSTRFQEELEEVI
ncbi:DUF2975 domain-containing protein [Microbacterium sp. BG28]|uniref:DUF2975 domain-containing protein n=1 Tax=Microbacterium sp. BG28 TaxID=3097356 RepID=UPI002A5A9EE6|nr:DUF2975 domain-containing protein [Microbacterium sp. BG28]MDY0827775.1 DUF2975 domain-containing protein [Microbacterium sp. BG28]